MMRLLLLLPLAWLAISPAAAQFDNPAIPCPLGTAEARLRGADVEAALFTNGNLFFGNTTTNGDGYITPLTRTGPRDSPLSPLFVSNLWLGGQVGGEVRVAGSRYGNFAMRPGHVGPDGSAPSPEACAAADRIWVVSREDLAHYLNGHPPEADLAEWPVHLGAPVLDGDGIPDNYDLASGDQPAIRGDVMAFWHMTDTAADLSVLGNAPLGVDVAVEAFAFRQRLFAQHTVYRFTITNRNAVPIDSAYVGLFMDVDLGDAGDDYVGTDTTAQMHYYYNSNETDAAYGIPPAFGAVVARGPVGLPNGRDDDGDGMVDESSERLGLSSSLPVYGSGPKDDPSIAIEYYNRLGGLWNDGRVVRENGSGYNQPPQFPVTTFVFAADPITDSFWSEVNNDGQGTDNGAGDRRGNFSTGPFRLASGASESVTFALVFAQGGDRFDSIRELRAQARGVLGAQASGAFEPSRVDGPTQTRPLAISRPRPNPFREATEILLQGTEGVPIRVSVYDVLGRRLSTTETSAPEARVEIGRALASGVYVVRVEGRGFAETFPVVKTE